MSTLAKDVASESGHYYFKDGTPCYTVIGANGNERATTLRDARKLDLVPSVTTITRVAAAPGLERWKSQQLLMAALTLPRQDGESTDGYMERVVIDSQVQVRKRAEQGTAIHGSIEKHLLGRAYPIEHEPFVLAAMKDIEPYAHDFLKHGEKWSPEKSFSCVLGYGGKVDLHCPNLVIDFKTKEFSEDAKKLAWPEQAMQLAAYRHGLGMPGALCLNVFISVSNPGLARIHVWDEKEIKTGFEKFRCLLHYWKLDRGLEGDDL